jgi:HEAT repeat protein
MEPWGLLAIGAFVLLARWAIWMGEQNTRARRLRQNAKRALGLDEAAEGALEGRIDGFRVRLEPLQGASATLTIDLGRDSRESVAGDIRIRPVTMRQSLAGQGDVTTGDEAFDNAVDVWGRRDEVLAVLDAPTRQLIDQALADDFQIAEGRLRRRVYAEHLVELVREAVDLAGRLSLAPEAIPGRLAQNARHDPLAEVRLRNLEALLEDYRDRRETQTTLRALLNDPSQQVRLQAALASGKDGHAALAALISDSEYDEPVVLKTLDVLTAGLPKKDQWPVLDAALAHDSAWVRQRALAQVARLGGPKAAMRLARCLADAHADIAAEAARALAKLGNSSCEGPLIEALGSEDLNVRQAAAEALGYVGTVAAVAPLQEAMGGAGMAVVAPDLRRAARHAIERIQGRLPGAKAGQLSLARSGGAAGEVSLVAEEKAGRVALSKRRATASKPASRPKSSASRRKKAAR